MNTRIPVLFIATMLLTACQKEDLSRVDLDKFEEPEVISHPEFKNLCCNDIIMDQSIIVINDWCSDSGFFHVYKYYPVEKLFSFSNKGRGPGESLSPFYFNNIISPSDKISFSVYDPNLKINADYELYHDYSSDNLKKAATPVSKRKIPDQIFPSLNLTYYDSCFYGRDLNFEDGLFFVYDLKTNQKKWAEFQPADFYRKHRSSNLSIVLINNEIVNGEKGIIAVGMEYFNQVHFFDLQQNLIRSVAIGEDNLPVLNENGVITDDSFYYCRDMYGTKDFVYVLWGGQQLREYKTDIAKNSYVIVFNWDGTHVKTYKIPYSARIGINPENTVMFSSVISSDGTTEISSYSLTN